MINIREMDVRDRYIHIRNDEQTIVVIDTLKGEPSDMGGLYLWHFTFGDDFAFDFDLNGSRTLKIIGVDMV